MIILGIGSNLGDRLENLRHGLCLLKKTLGLNIQQISPLYISDALLPDDASTAWNKSYLNLAIRCETTLTPYELLHQVKKIEQKIGRVPEKRWGPRVIDIDLLAWDDLTLNDETLQLPHKQLFNRPFALWPLADVAPFWCHAGKTAAEIAAQWGSPFSGDAPFHTRQIAQRIDTPQLIGIMNITPDSFSDGGKYTAIDAAVSRAKELVTAGAEILDIGAEATNPRATAISATSEWERLAPVLTVILAESTSMVVPPKISIDTRHTDVAEKALAHGVHWINDVSGLEDPRMGEIIAASECDIVVMHHLGIPVDRARILSLQHDPVEQVLSWAEQRLARLTQQGIAKERIIFDVGIGFGKNAQQCLELLKQIDRFRQLDTRLLIGHSRKIFLEQFTPRPFAERDPETVALSLFLASQQIDYLRVHDVDLHARVFKVARWIH